MTPAQLAEKVFKLARKFHDAHQKRMDTQGADAKAEELADMADTADKAYSFISDCIMAQRQEEQLQAEKQVLGQQLKEARERLEQWEQAYRTYADMTVHNKLEEVDEYLRKRTGRQPESDGQRINAFKEILEKQPK